MKILQINKYYHIRGGADTVFINTIELLEKAGHTVIPFSVKNAKNKSSKYEHYFVDYPELSESSTWTKITSIGRFIYNRRAGKLLDKLLTIEKPDIAHIHLLFNGFSVAILPVLKKHNIPVVMTLHEYRLICPAYTCMDANKNICEKCLKNDAYWQCAINKCSHGNLPNSILLTIDSYFRKYFYKPVDYIDFFIFVNKCTQAKHIEVDPVFAKKSTILYNFTFVKAIADSKKEDYILYYGRLADEKGVSTLLKAVKTLSGVHVKVIGTGPLEHELKQSATSNVEFLGFKSGEELIRYVQQARFVVVPSECYESGIPLTLIEAMAVGTPVIGSRIGGMLEGINETEESRNGFLFEVKSVKDLANKITKALSLSEEEYKKMSANAINYVLENHSPNTYLDKLVGIYNSVIKQNQS